MINDSMNRSSLNQSSTLDKSLILGEEIIIDLLPVPVFTCDNKGILTSYNKKAKELWQREPVLRTDHWFDVLLISDINGQSIDPSETSLGKSISRSKEPGTKKFIITKQGGQKVYVTAFPNEVLDEAGNFVGTINTLADVTDIIRDEEILVDTEQQLLDFNNKLENEVIARTQELLTRNEELSKSEERYHKMIEEVEDYAIVLLDKDGIIQNWNKGAQKIKGYKESEIVGKSFHIFYLPEDRKRSLPDTLLNIAREKGKATHEGWRMRKDGTRFWGSIVITALHDDQNNVVGFSKVTRDLTEKKSAEDRLRDYANQLEFQNKELEQFAFAASHDMKEPLRKISFYNNYVIDHGTAQLDEKSKDYLNRSIVAVKRMTHLIEDLLTYSRTSSTFENFEETDLNELVEEIVMSHKDLIDENVVEFKVDQLPVIKAITFQFRQLLDNLVNNSLKYKHPARKSIIRIECKRVPGTELTLKEADPHTEYWQVSVIDNGIGFDPRYEDKIFEIFQRLTNQSGYKGSGIGLAICKKIAQNHRGMIRATGEENEGATFDIFIPVDLNNE